MVPLLLLPLLSLAIEAQYQYRGVVRQGDCLSGRTEGRAHEILELLILSIVESLGDLAQETIACHLGVISGGNDESSQGDCVGNR